MQRLRLARRLSGGGLAFLAFFAGGCLKAAGPPGVPTVVIPVTAVGESSRTGIDASGKADAPHIGHDADGPAAGDRVEVEWQGSWFPATILERKGDRWLIHYDRFGDGWDETVERERIRPRVKPVQDEASEDDGDP